MILLIFLIINFQGVFLENSIPKLIVISYSGFRHDYFARNVTPFMNQLRNNWVNTDHMTSVFATKENPNHYSIATGYYSETHGVLEDSVLDPQGKKIKNSVELYSYRENILPIWIVNEMEGKNRRSGSMMWPGGEFSFNGVKATYATEFDNERDWENRVDLLISWFLDPKNPINLAMMYFEEPKFHSRAFGIENPIIDKLLNRLDNTTKYLYDQLRENNLTDVNVIHLSDHGMVNVPVAQIINISAITIDEAYEVLGSPSTKFIEPKDDNGEAIYAKLQLSAEETQGFEVYWKKEIPERYHFRNNRRVTDIFIIAKPGFIFEEVVESFDYWEATFDIDITNNSVIAVGGYDNEIPDMRPFFFATGPAFKDHCTLDPFSSVDLFPLFCDILKIDCTKSNGTIESFRECLLKVNQEELEFDVFLVVIVVIVIFVLAITSVIIYSMRRYRRRKQYIVEASGKTRGGVIHQPPGKIIN